MTIESTNPTTPNVGSAITRLYGSPAALNVALDGAALPARSVWDVEWADPDLTTAAERALWADTHEAFATDGDEQFAIMLAKAGDEAAKEAITRAYMPALKTIVRRHHGDATWRQDVRQTALLGLWEAVAQFDPSRHRRLAALVNRRVFAALSDAHAARFAMSVPEPQRLAYAKARNEAAKLVQTDAGTGPDLVDLAAEMAPEFGLSTVDYWLVDRVIHLGEVLPSGEVIHTGEDAFEAKDAYAQPEAVAPLWPDDEPAPVRDALVSGLLDLLDNREREVIGRRFGVAGYATETEDEAAASMALSARRVRQIQAAALAKLRPTSGA